MLEFFREGGFGMFPVVALGVVMMVAAGRYAADPRIPRLHFVMGVGATLTVAAVGAFITNLAMVMWYLEDRVRAPDAEFARLLVTGLKESSRPAALAGLLMFLALVITCVGLHKATLREAPRA